MKNFKSLILGSAAAVFAVAGAQAADLPVKAKPVEYVKVCSAYGAGFYYIPGTDICLRVGGFLFTDFSVNDRGATGSIQLGNTRDRGDDWTAFRVRQSLILDARTNTEYGTLRSYFSGGMQWDTSGSGAGALQSAPSGPGSSVTAPLAGLGTTISAPSWSWYWNSAFIQFAGFTFGIANSFFDFDPSMVMLTYASKSSKYSPLIAYTAQLGSGISATISMEDATMRREGINTGAYTTGMAQNNYAAQFMPDFIANLRVDQAWGDAQVSAALHQVKVSQVTSPISPVAYGYAFLGGLNFKLPQLGAKDTFQIEGVWAKGATAFTGIDGSPYSTGGNGTQGGASYVIDGHGPILEVFDAYTPTLGAGGPLQLAKSYSLNTQFRHFWTPTLRSTLAYGYFKFDAPAAAQATGGFPDGRLHQVVGNLIWSPVKNLDIGTEVYWASLKTTGGSNPGFPTDGGNSSNDWWGGNFRVTRYW